MKTILTIRQSDISPNSPIVDSANFIQRAAARAVLLDSGGQVYLLNVTKHGYHKLPGGGVDDGESIEQALKRELLEEVGCHAEVLAELGEVMEYKGYDDHGLRQTSYCFLARQVGEQKAPKLEPSELAAGMIEVKVANIDEAINLLQTDLPTTTSGKFIQKRDLAILREAKKAAK